MINGGALNQQARFRVLGLRSAGDRRGLRLFRKLFPGHGFYFGREIMTGKITVNLAHTHDGDSLGDLLSAAVNITAPGSEKNSDRDKKSEAQLDLQMGNSRGVRAYHSRGQDKAAATSPIR
jgi:hypothetical protein